MIQRVGEVTAEDLAGSAAAAGEALLAIGGEDAECGVFKATAKMTAHDLLGFFAFVGIDADADKVAGGFDDVFLAELTVRRFGVTGSEDA